MHINPLSPNPTKWSSTLKQFVGELFPKNCLSVFDHFVGLALKALTSNSNYYYSDLVEIFEVYTSKAHTISIIITIIIISSKLSIIDTLKNQMENYIDSNQCELPYNILQILTTLLYQKQLSNNCSEISGKLSRKICDRLQL